MLKKDWFRTVPATNLRLWNNELEGIAVICAGNRVIKNADSLEQMPSHLYFTREV